MYAPTTPALSAAALPSNGIVAVEGVSPSATPPALTALPVATALRVRHATLNVLDGHAISIAGSLRTVPHVRVLRTAAATGAAVPVADAYSGAAVGVAGAPAVAAVAIPAAVPAVVVKLQAHERHGWRTLAETRTGARGRYRLRYVPRRLGSERLRVRFAGVRGERAAQRAVGRLNVYRPVVVSWYGGGGSLACGGWLTSGTLGVASRTLPCGTLVTLDYHGRRVRVPVVDRGPYVAGREYDLTEATKRALGFEGVGEMWATS